MNYMGPLLAVREIAPARYFYETLLAQTVKYDFGVNVTFVGDFSLHLRSHLHELMGHESDRPVAAKMHETELTFETPAIEEVQQRLQAAGVELVHELREQPWGQRVLRAYDPDGHVVEIGEAMDVVITRMFSQGWSMAQIVAKTGMPAAFVEAAVRGSGEQ